MVGKVIVVGAINTDLVITTPTLPVPGETVVGSNLQTFGGGKGANAAVAASRAGANVTLIGAVGNDEYGKYALESLQNDGVNVSNVAILKNETSGIALITVDTKGENQIVLSPGANGAVSAEYVRDTLTELLPSADIVLVSTEIPFKAIAAAVETTSKFGVKCVLNPAPVIPGLEDLLAFGPILTPNEIELDELANNITGVSKSGERSEKVSDDLYTLNKKTESAVIATLGAEGSAFLIPGGEVEQIPCYLNTNVVDTTGAGDTFNGVLVTQLAVGEALNTAVNTAVIAASLSVSAAGAREGMPDKDSIANACQQHLKACINS